MESLRALVERRPGADRISFQRDARAALAAHADGEGLARLAIHVVDDEARTVAFPLGERAGFDAWIEIDVESTVTRAALLDAVAALGTAHVYRVEERRVVERPSSRNGTRTPGVEMVSPVVRAEGLDADAFDRHWRDAHAPLARRHHVGMSLYRQNAVREVVSDGSPHIDGVAVLGFPTAEAFETQLFDSDAGRAIIFEDTARFLSLDRSRAAIMGEYVLAEAGGAHARRAP